MTVIFADKWCVYGHYVDGRCIYIGMGRPGRAFGNTPARSCEWSALVKSGHEVEILSWHDTQSECLAREIATIRDVKPTCNKMHNGWVPEAFKKNWKSKTRKPHSDEARAHMAEGQRQAWKRGRASGRGRHPIQVRCVETGEIFESMGHAAAHIGASIAAVSAAIARQRPTVGYTFVKEKAS